MEGEERSTKKETGRSPFRPGSAPKSAYRVKQNNTEGQTPRAPKPKPQATPKKSDELVGSPPNLDAPIDFNSLQFEEERPQRRGIFDHVATPQRRGPPRVPKTPNTNPNPTNSQTNSTDPESAKKKRYRPRKKKTDDVSDEVLSEEVSNLLLKSSVDSFLNNNNNAADSRTRNNSTGKDISYNRVPPPASYEASSYPPTKSFHHKTPQKSDHQRSDNHQKFDHHHQKSDQQHQKLEQQKTPQRQNNRTPRAPKDKTQQQQQQTPQKTPNSKTPHKTPATKEGGESAKKRRPRKRGAKGENSEKKPPQQRQPQKTPGSTSKRARDRFEPYMDSVQVEDGLKNKTLYKGVIRINAHNPREAYVTCEGLDRDVYLDGQVDRNRAFEGDSVIVQLYDKSKWKHVKKSADDDDEEEEEEAKIPQHVVEEFFDDDEEDSSHKVNKKLFSMENEKGIDSEEESRYETVKELEEEEMDDDDEESDSDEDEHSDDEEEEEEKPVHPKEQMHKEQEREEEEIIKKQNEEAIVAHMSQLCIQDVKKTQQATPSKPKHTPSKSSTAASDDELQPSGKVVCILESKQNKEIVGYIKPVNEGGVKPDDRFASFVPMDIKLPRMIIPIGQVPDFYKDAESYNNKLVIAELLSWKSNSYLPLGKYKGILGESGDIVPETEAILIQHRIDASDFPPEVLDSIPKESFKISNEEIARRRDLRNYRIFTVDPATAKDLDDALHITPLSDGNYEVGVHIADVSFFVKPGTKLDEIAKERSTSVYFVQKVIPMLPNILCENLCSLNPGVDRLAFSVIWKLTPQGEILSEWFGRTVIRSCSKMTYDVAQYIIEGKIKESFKEMHVDQLFKNLGPMGPHTVPEIVQDVLNMHKIAANMRRLRFKNGALSMNNVKLSFKLNEFGNPVSYAPYITREANHMIEEYMLLANQQVAAKIAKAYPLYALLRNHTNPLLRKLDTFVKFCAKNLGVPIDPSNAKSLGQSLESLGKSQSSPVFAALRILATRSMQLAKYFCTGNIKREEWRHYALNVDTYTHFTSPIRRYPDVVVHRQLQAALSDDLELNNQPIVFERELQFTQQELTRISNNANDKKLLSRKAQEDSMKLYLCVFLKNNPVVEDAVVLSIGEKYVTVILTSLGFEKRIFIEDLVLNGFKLEDNKLILYWPSIPNEISKDNVEQTIKILSLIRVKVSTKLVRGRPELHLMLLHPMEAQGVLGLAASEPPKVTRDEIPTAEYFADENMD